MLLTKTQRLKIRLEDFPRLAGRLHILPQTCVAIDGVGLAMRADSSFAPGRAYDLLIFSALRKRIA